MKRHIVIMMAICLIATSITACGKSNDEEQITKIEANNMAESKEQKEKKYEEPKEPDVAPDRNSTTSSDVAENNTDGNEITMVDRDPSIYGIWSSSDNTNLTIFNSSQGVKFIMYDAPKDSYITGDITTDNSTYIEMKYLKPVKPEETVEPAPTEEGENVEDSSVNPYGSDEELYAAIEREQEEKFETVRYSIDKNEFNKETATMYLTISGSGRTLEMSMTITNDTPDYSTENNELAADMLGTEEGSTGEEAVEGVVGEEAVAN